MVRSHNESLPICRICRSGEHSVTYDKAVAGEPLISPCYCKGTMGLYHRSCLEHWLTSSNTNACEICHFNFETRRRYPTFCEFVRCSDCYVERRNLATDITCFIFLTPVVIGCIALCVFSSATHTSGFRYWKNITGCQAISLLALSFFLSIAYSIWLSITVTFHIKAYLDWRIGNEEIYVIVDQQPSPCSQYGVKRYRRGRYQPFVASMRLLCFNFRSFLRSLCNNSKGTSSAINFNSGMITSVTQEGNPSTSSVLDITYNEFVRQLQHSEIYATSLSRFILASTPVPSETLTRVPIFDYPSIKCQSPESSSFSSRSSGSDNVRNNKPESCVSFK